MRQRTYFMIKPDGVQRDLIGEVVRRIEMKGYKICAMKMLRISREMAIEHYEEHMNKPFFYDLVEFITSGPVVAMVLEGENAVDGIRGMMGMTDPKASASGTLRGDFGINLSRNVVHGSDSPASAEREISIFFRPEEILDFTRNDEKWLYPEEK
ncbi:MAG: nucleoside-diphosphate kinase [Candidatus Thermoplasmatota archaeon]|nr:nucleoside-diphosphate kinase [Candidatus Thermoplasmatota archaeon]